MDKDVRDRGERGGDHRQQERAGTLGARSRMSWRTARKEKLQIAMMWSAPATDRDAGARTASAWRRKRWHEREQEGEQDHVRPGGASDDEELRVAAEHRNTGWLTP